MRLLGRVFKLAIAEIVPKPCARAFIRLGRAVRLVGAVEGAEQISLNRPLHIIRDYQVEFAVAIVIHPGSAGGKFIRPPQAGGLGYIGKRAVAIVVKQMALTERGDKYIVITIVVVISDRNAQTEHRNRETGFGSHVGERAIVIVVIKLRSGLRAGMSGPIFAIDEQNVRPAVVVVVDESATRAHGFGQIFFPEGGVIVSEMDSGLGGDVAEGDLLARSWQSRQKVKNRIK